MPLYHYLCRNCRESIEAFRSFDRRDQAAYCPQCERWSGRRVLTAPMIQGETVARVGRFDGVVGDARKRLEGVA